jgi:hypothetical protein
MRRATSRLESCGIYSTIRISGCAFRDVETLLGHADTRREADIADHESSPGLRCKRNFVPPRGIAEVIGLLQSIDHPTEGPLRVAGPATWSRTPPTIRQYPPRLGEHGGAILCEAGFTAGEIEALIAEGAMVEAGPA